MYETLKMLNNSQIITLIPKKTIQFYKNAMNKTMRLEGDKKETFIVPVVAKRHV